MRNKAFTLLASVALAASLIGTVILSFSSGPITDPIVVSQEDAWEPPSAPAEITAHTSAPPTDAAVETSEVLGVSVTWYDQPRPDYPHPNGSALDNYRYYKAFADEGDGFAAHQLANIVLGCFSSRFRTEDELNTAIRQMRETFSFVYPESGRIVRARDAQEAEIFIRSARNRFAICGEEVGAPRDEYGKWLEIGANDGYTVAMLDYANFVDDPVASVELIRSAWNLGDANALRSLAATLQGSYEDGTDPTANVPAYSAMYAFVELRKSRYPANEESVIGRITLRLQQELDEMGQLLLPHELEAAIADGKALIEANESCCYSM